MKKFFIFFSIILVLFLSRGFIIKTILQKTVRDLTGLSLKIDQLDLRLTQNVFAVKGLQLFNPVHFDDQVMADVPEIYLHYDLAGFIKGKIHFYEIRLYVKEFLAVKNREGEVNLDHLKSIKEQKQASSKPPPPKTKGAGVKFNIDELSLKIGKVVSKDYSKQPQPDVREFPLNIDEHFQNVDDPRLLINLIVVRAVAKTTIGSLLHLDIKGLQNLIEDKLISIPKGVIDKTFDMFKKAVDFIPRPAGE